LADEAGDLLSAHLLCLAAALWHNTGALNESRIVLAGVKR
jgi:hypothetical protein